jgi:hypothetical protein
MIVKWEVPNMNGTLDTTDDMTDEEIDKMVSESIAGSPDIQWWIKEEGDNAAE